MKCTVLWRMVGGTVEHCFEEGPKACYRWRIGSVALD